MSYDYKIFRMLLTFRDTVGHKIAEHDYDLKSDDLNFPAMSPGHRIELDHEGATVIGTIEDVKHVLVADGSNNFRASLHVICTDSHLQ